MDASELAMTARMALTAVSRSEELERLRTGRGADACPFSHMRGDRRGGAGARPRMRSCKENRLREDVEDRSRSRPTHCSENAPEREERFIVIPNVL